MRFSCKFLTIFSHSSRQSDGEGDAVVCAFGGDVAAVLAGDGAGNGEPQSGAAARGAGSIESEELLEETGELFWRNGVALIGEADDGNLVIVFGADGDGGVRPAVEDGVAQEIIKNAREFVRVGAQR